MNLPVHQHLDKLKIPYQRKSFPTTIEKGAASVARELGFREFQMVKTLIFETKTGEKCLVMLPGDKSAKSGLLKKALGSKNIKMAHPDAVLETTGYQVGSIPPFHWQPDQFRSFIEATLMDEEILGVGAGQWGEEILITPHDLVKASSAQIVPLVPQPSEG